MARKQKSREVAPNYPRGHERVNLDRDNIELDPPQRRRSVRDYVSASTNVWGIVSIIVVLGLIATVFFAYYNSTSTSETIQYFSPSLFLSNLTLNRVVYSGEYLLEYDVVPPAGNTRPYSMVSAYIDVGGYKIVSEDSYRRLPSTNIRELSFSFDIGGNIFYSAYNTDYGLSYLIIDRNIEINTEMPDFNYVAAAWSVVDGLGSFWNAIKVTGIFLGDFISYQGSILETFLPWNSVAIGDRNYLPDLWEAAEERNGF